jgi:hypothetical protein
MITIIALCCVIAVLEILHCIERRDLYSRIMSRGLSDYTAAKKKKPRRESKITRMVKDWRAGGDDK